MPLDPLHEDGISRRPFLEGQEAQKDVQVRRLDRIQSDYLSILVHEVHCDFPHCLEKLKCKRDLSRAVVIGVVRSLLLSFRLRWRISLSPQNHLSAV